MHDVEVVAMNMQQKTKKRATATTLTPTTRTTHASPSRHYAPSTVAVDDARLLLAIQALDAASDASISSYPHAAASRVLHALAYFLEISIHLEEAEDEATRQRVALVLEARVLSCIARFLRGKARRRPGQLELLTPEDQATRPAWESWRCVDQQTSGSSHGCTSGVIRTALLCFLFQLCRQATSAVLVLRSGLHAFLFDQCRQLHADSHAGDNTTHERYYNAQDLLVGVDPFEWSTRGLWTVIQREGPRCGVFVLPIGARSLSYLLQNQRIPTNESEEAAIQLKKAGLAPSSPSCTSPLKSPIKNGHPRKPQPRHLPSIFHFPTHLDSTTQGPQRCVVCSPLNDAQAWKTVRNEATRLHFAVRGVVTLALHLPSTSPERKTFLRDGGLEALKLATAYRWTADGSLNEEAQDAGDMGIREPARSDSCSELEAEVIRAIAIAGVRLMEDEPTTTGTGEEPTKHRKRLVATPASPLRDKLQAITEETRRQVARQQRLAAAKQRDDEREELRRRVRELLATALRTRAHLLRSLAVLTIGREHPAGANQSIVEWLDSFPTIEKKEQQRKEQEEQRQRRLLELQYVVDERRRRQRDECLLMEKNDVDTPDIYENVRDSAKREAFLKLQQEMREMEQREKEEQQQSEQTATKREAVVEEGRRVQMIANQIRRETQENELMKKEDHYYAEKILREKQQREQQDKQSKQTDPIAEQQKRIERMRQQDRERKQIEQDVEAMRSEDLLARQMRFLDNQRHKEQTEREWKARRQMEVEERFLRQQWKRIDEAATKQQQEELRQQRAEERRLKREQEQQWKAWQAAWLTSYDAYGNVYYYNQLTGETQWENPLQHWTGTGGETATTDQAAALVDTSQWPQ